MHFSLQNKPKNILKNPWIIISMIILLVIACAIGYVYQGIAAVYTILFLVICTTIAVLIKSVGKKGFPEFDTTDRGVSVNGKLYPWANMKYLE